MTIFIEQQISYTYEGKYFISCLCIPYYPGYWRKWINHMIYRLVMIGKSKNGNVKQFCHFRFIPQSLFHSVIPENPMTR
jgi:hypothetical protein